MPESVSLAEPVVALERDTAGDPSHIPALDGLRGTAVLLVFAHHLQSLHGVIFGDHPVEQVLRGVTEIGWCGVDLFFVLSGFLITRNLLRSITRTTYYRQFYWRRVLRILPLYYTGVFLFYWAGPAILLFLGQGGLIATEIQPGTQLSAWLHVFNWLVGERTFAHVPLTIAHFWSLSVEEQFYLFWPLVVRETGLRRLGAACLAVGLISLVARLLLRTFFNPHAPYVWTISRMDTLALGAFLAMAIESGPLWGRVVQRAGWAMGLSLAGFASILFATRDPSWNGGWTGTFGIAFLGIFFGGLLVSAIDPAPGLEFIPRVFSSPTLRMFGKYSYAIYIFHHVIIYVTAKWGMNSTFLAPYLGGRLPAHLAVAAINLAAALAASLVSWHLLEKRFLALRHRPPFGMFSGKLITTEGLTSDSPAA